MGANVMYLIFGFITAFLLYFGYQRICRDLGSCGCGH